MKEMTLATSGGSRILLGVATASVPMVRGRVSQPGRQGRLPLLRTDATVVRPGKAATRRTTIFH